MREQAMTRGSLDALAARFRTFSDVECRDEPLYRALCDAIARDDDALGLLRVAPAEQQRPNLLLAAVHDVLLAGADHPLREYFPDLGGGRAVDAALPEQFADFRTAQHEALIQCLGSRTTQTNEVGRCAVLWPALQAIGRRLGRSQLALIDIGCSAGLNLGVDRYRYEYGELALGPVEAEVAVRCRLAGERRPDRAAGVEIVERLGIDPSPLDVDDEAAVRWLRACIWPHDRERRARFDRAVASARRERWPVRREADCAMAAQAIVAALPSTVLPLLFNSWVLTYLDPAARDRHHRIMEALVARGAAWLSAEPPSLQLGDAAVPALVEDTPEHREATLWTSCTLDGGRVRYRVVARAHPHGTWMQWLGT